MNRVIWVKAPRYGDLECKVLRDTTGRYFVRGWKSGPEASRMGLEHVPEPSEALQLLSFNTSKEAMFAAFNELIRELVRRI